jgi:hypothetical protein
MRKKAAAILLASFSIGSAFAQRVIKVDSARKLVEVIAPGAAIELAPGSYDLGSVGKFQSRYISWDDSLGEREIVVANVEELSISGEGAEIAVTSPYARVLTFRGCSNLALSGLSLVHLVTEDCMAGVLRLEKCADVAILGCSLRGSGAVGLEISDSNGIEMGGGSISGCNAGAVWIDGSWNVHFNDVTVTDNRGGYPFISVDASNGVSFTACYFTDNSGDAFLSEGRTTEEFGFDFCEFSGNQFEAFSYEEPRAYFFEARFGENSFDEQLGTLVEYGGDGMDGMGGLGYYEVPGSGLAFEYPGWLALDETDGARIVIDTGDPEESSGIVIAKVYDLKRTDDPDTQATRIFKTAAPFAERALAYSGLSVKRRLSEKPVNTEAPPYHYEYYAEGRSGSDPVTLRIKLRRLAPRSRDGRAGLELRHRSRQHHVDGVLKLRFVGAPSSMCGGSGTHHRQALAR